MAIEAERKARLAAVLKNIDGELRDFRRAIRADGLPRRVDLPESKAKKLAVSIVEVAAMLHDAIEDRDPRKRGSMTTKVRRALGFLRP